MKMRTVIVTLELDTDLPRRDIKKRLEMAWHAVRQVQFNTIRTRKQKAGPLGPKRKARK